MSAPNGSSATTFILSPMTMTSRKFKGSRILIQSNYSRTPRKRKVPWNSTKVDRETNSCVSLINDKLRIGSDIFEWGDAKYFSQGFC